jgi:hypothetical protein
LSRINRIIRSTISDSLSYFFLNCSISKLHILRLITCTNQWIHNVILVLKQLYSQKSCKFILWVNFWLLLLNLNINPMLQVTFVMLFLNKPNYNMNRGFECNVKTAFVMIILTFHISFFNFLKNINELLICYFHGCHRQFLF